MVARSSTTSGPHRLQRGKFVKQKQKMSTKLTLALSLAGALIGMGIYNYFSHDTSVEDAQQAAAFTAQLMSQKPVVQQEQKPDPALYSVEAENALKRSMPTTSDDLQLSRYTYSVGPDSPLNCKDDNGDVPIECSKVAELVPMLSPEQVKARWCENGVCMAKDECKHIVGADPIFLHPENYGISDWGAYHETNYKKHDDPAVCK